MAKNKQLSGLFLIKQNKTRNFSLIDNNNSLGIKMKSDTNSGDQKNFGHFIKDSFTFIGLVLIVYVCYITSGVYHEKILKHQYLNPSDGKKSYFEQAIVFTVFPQLFATIIGYLFRICTNGQNQYSNASSHPKQQIPWKKSLVCGLIVNFNMYTYNQAVVQASFPAVVMVKSCSLLSVILVGVFCSRVKDKMLKLKRNKIIIGVLACVGIFIFNFFKKTQNDSVDKPITLISSMLLIASLIGDGFLPDFQAEIKSEYKPSVMEMYLQINKFTFLASFTFIVVTGKIFYFFEFFNTHDQIVTDIAVLSILNSLGQIVIYKMIKLYKQHIPAFVIGIRKCLTVVVNIFYFGHSINGLQSLSICFVFCSILWQTYDNYLQKQQKQRAKQLQNNEQNTKLVNQIVNQQIQPPMKIKNLSNKEKDRISINTLQAASLKNTQQ